MAEGGGNLAWRGCEKPTCSALKNEISDHEQAYPVKSQEWEGLGGDDQQKK